MSTFTDCLTAYMNLDEPAVCLGSNYINSTNSTSLVEGGLCWLLWDVKNPTSSSDANIGILQVNNATNNTSSLNQTSVNHLLPVTKRYTEYLSVNDLFIGYEPDV